MAKEKLVGAGTIVEIDFTGAATSFDQILCAQTLTAPPIEREAVEASCLELTRKDYVAGVKDGTDFVFLAFWDPADPIDAKARTAASTGAPLNVKVTYPYTVAYTESFDGFITSLEPQEVSLEEVIAYQITIRATTESVIAAVP